jgi:UDPglucose--hexose-1-phosphate uridylyltransferase
MSGGGDDRRIDPHLGTAVWVVGSRQARPNLPDTGCPFCPGGLEAPDAYDVRWFPNRWPAMPDHRCEVVLYTPVHDATFPSLGVAGARRVIDLWADRTAALGARPDVDFVFCFENRGPEVGATITHPHGQIYAYEHVPSRQRALFESPWAPDTDPGERRIAASGRGDDSWQAYVPWAPVYPVSLVLAPTRRVPDLPSLDDAGRDSLAQLLVDVLTRLDRLYGTPLPYMMWISQRPTDKSDWPDAWMFVEIVSPWRRRGVPRFIAAAEVGGGELFNPVVPEELAATLRALVS